MKPWALLTLLALYATNAYAWAPSLTTDQVGTSAQFGKGFFLQTVSVSDHFSLPSDRHNNYFLLKEKAASQEQKDSGTSRKPDTGSRLMNLSWFLGYAYYRTDADVNGTAVYDDAHAFKIGLAWELGKRLDMIFSGGYQVLPAENYSQGMYNLYFGYTIPLTSEPGSGGNTRNEEQYYVNKELESHHTHLGATDRFPNIRVGFTANFSKHTKSPTTAAGRPNGTGLAGDLVLNQSYSGPVLDVNLSRRVNLRLKALFWFYDSDVANFLGQTTIGGFRPKADLAVADLQDTTPLLLVFPKRTLSASTSLWLGPAVNLKGELAYNTFDATSPQSPGNLDDTISFGGIVDFVLARRVRLGGSVDVTAGGGGYHDEVGGVSLGYAL